MRKSCNNVRRADKDANISEEDCKEAISFVALLKDCAKNKDLCKGSRVHADIVESGLLETNHHVACTLVSMYAKCGDLEKSREVHSRLPQRNVVAWNALIAGYVQQQQAEEALKCFAYMQNEAVYPNVVTFICILKACSIMRDIGKGNQIYDDIVTNGLLGKDIALGNALVDMYAKSGHLVKAEQVLEKLSVRNVISWNSLITGYTQQGQGKQALSCYERMQREGISPSKITFVCLLKACGSIRATAEGKRIHDEIVDKGLLGEDVMIGTALVDMYVKFGTMIKAKEVFDKLAAPNIVSWNALLSGFVQYGQAEDALNCFNDMKRKGISPDAITFTSILKACAIMGDMSQGKKIHDNIVSRGLLGKDIVLDTALVDMYAKCGAMRKAEQVFMKLPVRNLVTWNTIIAGYAQHGHGEEAVKCLDSMRNDGFSPDIVTYVCILRACGSMGFLEKGKQIHDEIANNGLLMGDVILGNALIDMYAKCGEVEKAHKVLYGLPIRDEITWNSLITGYVAMEKGKEALECFSCMQDEGFSPDTITFIGILKACGNTRSLDFGEVIHEEIINKGLLAKDIVLGNALVDMYAKCGALTTARKVLHELPGRDIISWNALVAGYVQLRQGEEALHCLEQIQTEGLSPDFVTYLCTVKACGIIHSLEKGEQIHNMILNKGFLEKDIVLVTALVDMYAKCGATTKAEEVFEKSAVRDVVLWNVLVAAHAQQGQGDEALRCFNRMQVECLSPDAITFGYMLKVCGSTGAFENGNKIHDEILNKGWLEKDIMLSSMLVDMYAKCGAMEKAEQVFREIPNHDVVSWNSLMSGYAQKGQVMEAMDCFKRMQSDGLLPDEINFLCVLNACSHCGLVDEGEMYFMDMTKNYAIAPDMDHYTCMVDLFGRTGQLDKAMVLITKMPSSGSYLVWDALLGACKKWGDVRLGRLIFERAIQFDPHNGAAYVLMSNIYVAAGFKEDAGKILAMQMPYGDFEEV